MKREHFGLCRVIWTEQDGTRREAFGGYPTMVGAVEALDPFTRYKTAKELGLTESELRSQVAIAEEIVDELIAEGF